MAREDSPFHNLSIEENPVLEVTAQEVTLEQELEEHLSHYKELKSDSPAIEKAKLEIDIAECKLGLDLKKEAHEWVHKALPVMLKEKNWESVIDACDIIYNCEEKDGIIALGNAIWLAITFPVDPNITVNLLHHIIEETPDDSDGAAVAAMMAHFIAESRAQAQEKENLTFLTTQIVAKVAERHRGIKDQETLNTWIQMYELDDMPKLLEKLGIILDAITANQWWYDRDMIREELPVN
ncbi:MAG: hypothetical protein ISR69_03365 [Gammaproteobacteria bacterium]|nr:hypothetical protein [Gammaproteobacteria bacterium]